MSGSTSSGTDCCSWNEWSGCAGPCAKAVRGYGRTHPVWLYLGPIAVLTALFAANLLSYARAHGAHGWLLALCGVLVVLGASQLAVALVNWLVTLVATPHALPRMDYRNGIPAEARTLVVVPTMLASAKAIDDMAEALEVRFLANRDPHLHFGLLTDFVDARRPPCRRTVRCSTGPSVASKSSTRSTAQAAAMSSSCCTGRAATTPENEPGWVSSASAASSRT